MSVRGGSPHGFGPAHNYPRHRSAPDADPCPLSMVLPHRLAPTFGRDPLPTTFIQRRPECRLEIGAVRRLSNGPTAELVGVAPAQVSDLGRPNESLSRH